MSLDQIRKKKVRFVVGLMSGSSCDGITAALVRIEGSGPDMNVQLGRCETYPYPPSMRVRLLAPNPNAREICQLNFELGELFAEAAEKMKLAALEQNCEVDIIASHGHTIVHIPPRDGSPGSTLQIGEADVITERTGLPVVSDFRTRDMAVGGQGAPLVPYADWILFSRKDRTMICLNIGGIANFTIATPNIEDVTAFDSGPGNMAIDSAVRHLTRGTQQMDKDGIMAASGRVIPEFREYLLDHPYFRREPPKTTGREEFGFEVYLRDALNSRASEGNSPEDLVATVTAATAQSIIDAYNRFIRPKYTNRRVIVGGGGVRNKTLMHYLHAGLPGSRMRTTDEYRIPHEAREAIAFAMLGNETIMGRPGNCPKATGAEKAVMLGKISPA